MSRRSADPGRIFGGLLKAEGLSPYGFFPLDVKSAKEDTMGLRDEPHYQVESSELADWLESQGTDIWWSVAGD